jgi:hypothetical protein
MIIDHIEYQPSFYALVFEGSPIELLIIRQARL